MGFIVLIGTKFYGMPNKVSNPLIYKIDRTNYRIGYLERAYLKMYDTHDFYTRAGFVFPEEFNYKKYKMDSTGIYAYDDDLTEIFPYIKIYDQFIVNGNKNYVSEWIGANSYEKEYEM